MNKFSILLIIHLLLACMASGQSNNFRHYQVENGLSYNSVICSIQDKKGFLWFGTKDGLNRFDGYSFKIFRNDPDNPKSLGNNFIHSLQEDTNQNIWVGTLNGLYKYDPLTESFTFIDHTKNKDIRDIKIDKEGNIWYIEGPTLCRYNEPSKKIISFDQRIKSAVTSICIAQNNEIWISTEEGYIHKYDPKSTTIEKYDVFHKSGPSISKRIEKLYDAGNGLLFIGTSNQGVKLFNTRTFVYKDILISDSNKTAIYARDFIQTGKDEYWIASESGIFVYNLSTGKYQNLRNKFNDPYSISDNAVYTLTKDKEGGLWAGTYFGGVSYYPKKYTYFDKFFPQGTKNSISGYAVREMLEDHLGNIWIGTEDAGLNKFNPKSGVFEHFMPNGEKTSISHSNIHGLLAVGNELWIGTFEQGLDVMDIRTSKIIRKYRSSPAPNALKNNFIESILHTQSGDILIGTALGLYRYNKLSDDFTLLNEVPGNLHYSSLLEDQDGNIWAGTLRDGLYYFHTSNKRSGYFKNEENNKNSLISNYINSIYQDSRGQLWITTENGLCSLNPDRKSFTRYNSKNGFPSDVFYKMLEDKKKKIWISTSRGLVNYNPISKEIKTFTKSNGLLSDQFNYSSALVDNTGNMYFGSVKGLVRFVPDQFIQNKYLPPLYITGFQVNNKELKINQKNSLLNQSINFTDVITLSYDQSTFSIDFAALGFTAPEMTEYSYIMEGLDKDWTFLKTNRKAYFTELAPGTYIFKLKAANSNGVWNKHTKELKVIINPPFWASTWAYIVYSALFFAIIFYGIHYYHQWIIIKNKRRIYLWESKKEKELYQAKINFFTYVTHEIRTPLTLINGPLEDILEFSTNDQAITENLMIMKKNTARLIELTDQLLDFRKTETKGFKLNFIYINISSVLEDYCQRFKATAKEKNLEYNVVLPEEPLYAYADEEALNKIISNLLDNAVKYAIQKIYIHLKTESTTFTIQVRSDGPTIPKHIQEKIFEPFYRMEISKDQKGTGIGLPLARALAELHEGTLKVTDEDMHWNVFILTLPLHHETAFKINYSVPEPAKAENIQPINNEELQTVLIVEDNIEIREFITKKLQHDFVIVQADHGEQALQILEKRSVHLIISDIMMPVMDGIMLCKTVKEKLDFTHIPIILLTAKNTLQSKIEGLEVGADAYIEKPFSSDHLLIQIKNLLTSRDKIKHYFARSPLVHIKSMAYNKADELFLEKLNELINKNLDNKSLDAYYLADVTNMSKPTFYRKIKAISNLTPHELINIARLKKAAGLLIEGNYKMSKIASMVGFSSQAQFTRSFIKQFGITPSEYIASTKNMVTED